MNPDRLRAHYAAAWNGDLDTPRHCPAHPTVTGWCAACEAGIDAAAARPEPDLSEGDMRALDRRAWDAMEREAS